MNKKRKLILVIRDGWGFRKLNYYNAIKHAKIPFTNSIMKQYPNILLDASGEAVGLPKHYQGNSEVGHLTIGSGRIINQSLLRINKSIETKEFFKNKELLSAINNCKKHNTELHLIGLLQSEGVHSHINHLYALLELCKQENFNNYKIHVITDGRDAPVNNSINNVKELLKKIPKEKIVTIQGRYYAMDRDKRWDRTKEAFKAIVLGKSNLTFKNPIECIKECYKNNETDEFIKPRINANYKGFKENDSVIFYNFRTDRPRQLTKAIVEKNFKEWKYDKKIFYVGMTQFYKPMNAKVAFKNEEHKNLLGEVLSKNNLKQLRISETEKYAHVTFFLNGQREKEFKGEDRILINSPKVTTYDKKPEMSVFEIQNSLEKEIIKEKYDVIITNFVNGDMVGHTGITPAIIDAVESVDKALEKTVKIGLKHGYDFLIFADHGNAEDQTKKWRTSHTINKVPFILISNDKKLQNINLEKNKGLKDIAPTVLKLLKIKQPKEMTGSSII